MIYSGFGINIKSEKPLPVGIGKEETIQNFEVTYYRPEGKKMDVQWISSDGRNGWVDYPVSYTHL